jgi:cell division protein FtsB
MPTRISDPVKSAVIQQWLEGIARDTIAANNDLSGGGVTNIINEWKQGLGSSVADGLRELAVSLKKIGITPAQCASGCRVEKIMINLGVKENGFEPFILEIYNRCKDLGLTPENIASHLKDLLDFSTTDAIPFSQIRNYVKQKADEKEKLEQEIKKLEWKIEMLTLEQSDRQFLRDQALQDERMTAADLKWYSNLKAELGKYDIPVDDISKFAKAVNGIRELGYDVGKVIREFSDYESVETQRKMLQDSVKMLQNELNHLSQKCSSLENTVNSHEQIISIFKELEGMGFGLEELKLLWNTINEIAVANNIPLYEAQQKFFKDVEEQYDNKLGFESKAQNIQLEINKLSEQNRRLALVGPLLARLVQSGVNEQDIINVAYIFNTHIDSKNNTIYIQLLISDLHKYGPIKSVIQQLSQDKDNLTNEIASLKTQKQSIVESGLFLFLVFLVSVFHYIQASKVSIY